MRRPGRPHGRKATAEAAPGQGDLLAPRVPEPEAVFEAATPQKPVTGTTLLPDLRGHSAEAFLKHLGGAVFFDAAEALVADRLYSRARKLRPRRLAQEATKTASDRFRRALASEWKASHDASITVQAWAEAALAGALREEAEARARAESQKEGRATPTREGSNHAELRGGKQR